MLLAEDGGLGLVNGDFAAGVGFRLPGEGTRLRRTVVSGGREDSDEGVVRAEMTAQAESSLDSRGRDMALLVGCRPPCA